ncbi:alpha/beta hydrolase family esterase [Paucibacter sp. Y2R2-4]|uniref:extracellular catalytic domain type 1 short-chain-length polyhydroxyalkanoate depolymerase n=1 Tax=Paucibacter sp. Y2R2-4 TaxID=2893553 RepID=UPI0021E365BE|nr:PHB depolymerase family esterase [Paucibacter sp. Y2R2-4]MCV2351578.1 prolyl oligopeptidase family serine peptidase [Paucibacter sp. Y2R2-4]
MKRVLRFLLRGFLGLLALLALLAGLFAYFLYTPEPELPQLSGQLTKGTIEVAGVKRSYRTYVPKDLPKGAPLVLVMHGSGESPGQIRVGTGYSFERLADQHGFALVYPKAYASDWNDCSRIGDKELNGVRGDDVGFLAALVDKTVAELALDPTRVFAAGVSNGGSMAMRLALEQPSRYKAVAAVVANVPAPENFQCQPAAQKATSVMIMNGTEDPLVPYAGGEINLLGLFYKGGPIISSRASAQYFADWARLSGAPLTSEKTVAEGVRVEQNRWSQAGKPEVELVSIHGGGHGLPQPYSKRPRLLGPSPMEPNGPAMIWAFFARQTK